MSKSVIKLSVRGYAKTLGISHPTVLTAIADGKIKKGLSFRTENHNGVDVQVLEIDPVIADIEFGNLYKSGRVRPGQRAVKAIPPKMIGKTSNRLPLSNGLPPIIEKDLVTTNDEALLSTMAIKKDLSFAEAARRRELISLSMDQKELQKLEGTLVKKSEVMKALYELGIGLKKAFFNMPARIAADLSSTTNIVEIQTIINVELTQILNELANMKEMKINIPKK
jgi:hypothetical protein